MLIEFNNETTCQHLLEQVETLVKENGVVAGDIRLWAASTHDGKNDLKTLVDKYDKQWRNEKECFVDALPLIPLLEDAGLKEVASNKRVK